MVIVDAGGAGSQAVRHLASEYDAQYIPVAADPDEAALLNIALGNVKTPWALFLNQQEVLHAEDLQSIVDFLSNTQAFVVEIPLARISEPGNYYFENRLLRTDRNLRWEHMVYPSLDASLEQVAGKDGLENSISLLPVAAIISLGEPEYEEWEFRDAVVRIERELDKNPSSPRYWYFLARTSRALEEWDRAHAAVEEGLSIVSKNVEAPHKAPQAVNGLIGMFCASLLAGDFYPEKTVESLWMIYNNMEGDGRFSVPLGQLLLAVNRIEDAISAQRKAVDSFFSHRRYYLSLEEGLYQPILFAWELEASRNQEHLLRSVIDIQVALSQRQKKIQPLLQHIHEHNPTLFVSIQEILQKSLNKLDEE
jgi:tetratricopeptide (TPR) repeat protein